MVTRILGKDGPEVSVIGFGAFPIGGGMGNIPEEDAVDALRAAVDSGQTFIDTAEAYSVSEERVGKALAEGDYRERAFIATKVSGNYTREHINQAIENSLRMLQTDCVDLYQIHGPSEPPSIEEQMEMMLELQEQGKIRFIGNSNYSVEHLERAWKIGQFHSIQPRYNMFDREIEAEIVPWCREHGVGILPHSPLGKGLLAGKYQAGHQFPEDDERSKMERFQGEKFTQYCAAANKLKAIAERKGLMLPQLAVGWTLRLPEVTVCLVGAKSVDQVHLNNASQGWTLTDDELSEIESILEEAPMS